MRQKQRSSVHTSHGAPKEVACAASGADLPVRRLDRPPRTTSARSIHNEAPVRQQRAPNKIRATRKIRDLLKGCRGTEIALTIQPLQRTDGIEKRHARSSHQSGKIDTHIAKSLRQTPISQARASHSFLDRACRLRPDYQTKLCGFLSALLDRKSRGDIDECKWRNPDGWIMCAVIVGKVKTKF